MALDTDELAAIRAEAERTILTDTAQILRNTAQTADSDALGGGGVSADWQPLGYPVPCRIAKIYRPRPELVISGQVRGTLTYETRFPVGTDIVESDRVQVTGGAYDGTYYVAEIGKGQSEMIMLYVQLGHVED